MSNPNNGISLPPRKELAQLIFDLDVGGQGILIELLKTLDDDSAKMMRKCLGVGNRRIIRRDGTGYGTQETPSMFHVKGAGFDGANGIYIADGNRDGVTMYRKRGIWNGEERSFTLSRCGNCLWFISSEGSIIYEATGDGEVPDGLRWNSLKKPSQSGPYEDSDEESDEDSDFENEFHPPPSTEPFDLSVLRTALTSANNELHPRMILAKYLLDLDSSEISSPDILEMIDYQCSDILQSTNDRLKGGSIHDILCQICDEEKVRSIVRTFPAILSSKNKNGDLPIHSAAASLESVSFVPMLAEEYARSCKSDPQKQQRGDLLIEGSEGLNVLEALICSFTEYSPSYDIQYTKVVKKLGEMNLLSVQDIENFNLLTRSCHPWSRRRFEVIFKMSRYSQIKSLLLNLLSSLKLENIEDDIPRVSLALKATMERYPRSVGFLFHKNRRLLSAYEIAVDKFGEDRTMEMVKECIPVHSQFPILHHVVNTTQKYTETFVKHYPAAMFLKDENNRSFHHIAISSGFYNYKTNTMILVAMPDEKIEEKDPYLNLYPFMSAAAAKSSDLTTIFYLLQRCPWVLHEGHLSKNMDDEEDQKNRPKRRRLRNGFFVDA